MSVSSITTFGSAAIATPPANNSGQVKPEETPEIAAAPPVEPAKPPGTGQVVDIKV